MNISLSVFPKLVIKTILDWYQDYDAFIFRGGRLFHNIFPNFFDSLESELIGFAHQDYEKNIPVVLDILRAYPGDSKINNTCMNIVKILPQNSKLIDELMCILDGTGVQTGEYGQRDAYLRKKQAVSEWLNSPDIKVQIFAKKYLAELDKKIIWETRRSEEKIEFLKHQFGDDKQSDNT